MDDLLFDVREESPKETLLNTALSEYEQATGVQWRYWAHLLY